MKPGDVVLQELAVEHVGSGQRELIFITNSRGMTVAAFSSGSFTKQLVVAIAKAMPMKGLVVEDETGVVWDADQGGTLYL